MPVTGSAARLGLRSSAARLGLRGSAAPRLGGQARPAPGPALPRIA
ncbi:hypothetical protein [Streptomyces sp. TRM64462]|nr:hypothetical protein [Streptomyces sp. TRM64462]